MNTCKMTDFISGYYIWGPPYVGKSSLLAQLSILISHRNLIKVPVIDLEGFYRTPDHWEVYKQIVCWLTYSLKFVVGCADIPPSSLPIQGEKVHTLILLPPKEKYEQLVNEKIGMQLKHFNLSPQDEHHQLKGALNVYDSITALCVKHNDWQLITSIAEGVEIIVTDFNNK